MKPLEKLVLGLSGFVFLIGGTVWFFTTAVRVLYHMGEPIPYLGAATLASGLIFALFLWLLNVAETEDPDLPMASGEVDARAFLLALTAIPGLPLLVLVRGRRTTGQRM